MLSVGNAIAAGMMLSASYSLVSEGATVHEPEGMFGEGIGELSAPWVRVLAGVLAGLVFILSTKKASADSTYQYTGMVPVYWFIDLPGIKYY